MAWRRRLLTVWLCRGAFLSRAVLRQRFKGSGELSNGSRAISLRAAPDSLSSILSDDSLALHVCSALRQCFAGYVVTNATRPNWSYSRLLQRHVEGEKKFKKSKKTVDDELDFTGFVENCARTTSRDPGIHPFECQRECARRSR